MPQNWMLWLGVFLIVLWYMSPKLPAAARLSPAQVKEAIAGAPGLQVIDVRTPGEYKDGHIAGAKLIPLQALGNRSGEIDKSRLVILVCRSGSRSAQAYKLLSGQGFDKLQHLEGGLSRWVTEGNAVQR